MAQITGSGSLGFLPTPLTCPKLTFTVDTMTTLDTPTLMDSNLTPNFLQDLNGLFNTGFTDDVDGVAPPLQLLSPSVKIEDSTTECFDDLITTLDTSELMLESYGSVSSSLGDTDRTDMDLQGSDNVGSGLPAASTSSSNGDTDALDLTGHQDYLEVFTDLTNFLTTEEGHHQIEALLALNETSVAEEVRVTRTGSKRTAEMAFLDTFQTNPDHDSYTIKRERASTSSECSEAAYFSYPLVPEPSPSSSSCFTSPEPTPAPSPAPSTSSSSSSTEQKKYVERRQKNNVASRRSRQSRKQKYVNMENDAVQLEQKNKELEQKIEKLEELTQLMKDILVNKMSGSR